MAFHEVKQAFEEVEHVHRSFIVNMAAVREVERNHIIFGKTRIPVADSRRDDFFTRLAR